MGLPCIMSGTAEPRKPDTPQHFWDCPRGSLFFCSLRQFFHSENLPPRNRLGTKSPAAAPSAQILPFPLLLCNFLLNPSPWPLLPRTTHTSTSFRPVPTGFRSLPIFTKWMSVYGMCFFIRTWFMLTTALPPTEDIKCRFTRPRPTIHDYLWNAALGVITLGNGNIHCGDLFFSGHTVLITCSWMAAISHLRHYPVAIVVCTLCIVGNMVLIIVDQNHYTMDVATSFYVTCTMWLFHPLKRPGYLTLDWYRSLPMWCATCWVSHEPPCAEEERAFLMANPTV